MSDSKVLSEQKALVVFPELGDPIIIMSTTELQKELDEVGSTKIDDLGLVFPQEIDRGMFVWEGSVMADDDSIEFGPGIWRAPMFDEVSAAVSGFSIWSDLGNEVDDDQDQS